MTEEIVRLNKRQEAFAQALALNPKDKVIAYKASGWSWENMGGPTLSTEAEKKSKHPQISLRVAQLRQAIDKVAAEVFTVTVEQRLRWLNEVAMAGLETYTDAAKGITRRENLPATTGAVLALNSMLGEGLGTDDAPIQTIRIEVVGANVND